MTPPSGHDYDSYSASVEELRQLYPPGQWQQVEPGVKEMGTGSNAALYQALQNNSDSMVQISGRDSANGIVQPLFFNEGEGYGLRASYILREMDEAGTRNFSDIASDFAQYGEVGEIDYFVIRVYEDE